MKDAILTRGDYNDYLIRLYFGWREDGDFLELCVNRAYRDFNRTLHKISQITSGHRETATITLKESLEVCKSTVLNQAQFDEWHKQICLQLQAIYRDHNYPSFYIGQAQKWINMTFKYIFTMGESRLSGYEKLFPFCHVPIDNILLEQLWLHPQGSEIVTLSQNWGRWSRWNDYDQYLQWQKLFREIFREMPPLFVEFHLWQGTNLPQ